jgi:hypothetical protein
MLIMLNVKSCLLETESGEGRKGEAVPRDRKMAGGGG